MRFFIVIALLGTAWLIMSRSGFFVRSKNPFSLINNQLPLNGYKEYVCCCYLRDAVHHKNEVTSFAFSKNHRLVLEQDPHAPVINLIGLTETGSYTLGALPPKVSKKIIKSNMLSSIHARWNKIYIGDGDDIGVKYSIWGPAENKAQFDGKK